MAHRDDYPVLDHVMTLSSGAALARWRTPSSSWTLPCRSSGSRRPSRVSSAHGRPSRLRPLVQVQDHPHLGRPRPLANGLWLADPADPDGPRRAIARREGITLLRLVSRLGYRVSHKTRYIGPSRVSPPRRWDSNSTPTAGLDATRPNRAAACSVIPARQPIRQVA